MLQVSPSLIFDKGIGKAKHAVKHANFVDWDATQALLDDIFYEKVIHSLPGIKSTLRIACRAMNPRQSEIMCPCMQNHFHTPLCCLH